MLLVTGVTGLNGSAVVRELAREGVAVRAMVRDLAKARGAEVPSTVEVVEGDMLRPRTLGPALDGVERVLLISAANERLVEAQTGFIDAAKAAGVEHVVKFSGRACDPESGFRFARMHAEIERYLRASGMHWTMLRPSAFMQVYFREVPSMTGDGVLSLPMGDASIAPVDVADIAKVAAALLQGKGEADRRYEMTGPESLTLDEIAGTVSSVIGRPVRYVDADPVAQREALLAAGLAPFFADALDELFAERRKGGDEARVELSTHEAFGVRPTTFAEFVRKHAAVFRGEARPANLWAAGWLPSDR
ncbi:SDR family oxidoreductase [Actinoallomurus sp. CA-142502]|uniref:SDR family oxidoreductase n=1 Tax=Actinoallomurus sp. CA-142502 TaxID=3239885 RepID=UPI003D8E0A56